MTGMRWWFWPALFVCCASSASANPDRIAAESAAGAVAAFEEARERCRFDPIINEAFTAIDRHYQASALRLWPGMKTQAATNNRIALQIGLAGPEGQNITAQNFCKVAARLMTLGLAQGGSAMFFLAYPGLESALQRQADSAPGSFLQQNPPPSLNASAAPATLPPATPRSPPATFASEPILRLPKPVVEAVFACLANNLTADQEPVFTLECTTKATSEFKLSPAQIFRLEYLIFFQVQRWSIEVAAPIRLPDPEKARSDCSSDRAPQDCMFNINWNSISALIKIINETKNPNAIGSLKRAFLEYSG